MHVAPAASRERRPGHLPVLRPAEEGLARSGSPSSPDAAVALAGASYERIIHEGNHHENSPALRFVAALALGLTAPAVAGDLKLTIENGRVTIDRAGRAAPADPSGMGRGSATRKSSTPRNSSARPSPSSSSTCPERQALDTLLRSTAGYLAAPRTVGVTGASVYDRIMILPTSRPPAAVASAAPPAFQPRQPPPLEPADDDDEPVNMPFVNPNAGAPNPNPMFRRFQLPVSLP